MNYTTENGKDVTLYGKSGQAYYGKIYQDKDSTSAITGKAIALLSNSRPADWGWVHRVNSVYNSESIDHELAHFKNRDDISHLILLPYSLNENVEGDKIDDLIRGYVHQ